MRLHHICSALMLFIVMLSPMASASWWDDFKKLSKEAIKHTSKKAENAIANGIAVEQPAQELPPSIDAHYAYFNEPVFFNKLVYKEQGQDHAQKVILVHGLGELAMQDWDTVFSELAKKYHVIALDLPGFGLSAKPYGRYSPTHYARVIHALSNQLGFEQFHLVGHSMGGAVSVKFAELYPHKLTGLILVSAAGIIDKTAFVKQFVDFSKFLNTNEYTERFVKQSAQLNISMLESIMLKGPQPDPLYSNEIVWSLASRDSPNANAALSLVAEDFREAVNISTPTFIIWGEHDPVAPIRTGEVLNHVLENSNLFVITGAGHVPMKSHRDLFLNLLNRSLSQLPAVNSIQEKQYSDPGEVFHCEHKDGITLTGNYHKLVLNHCNNVTIVNSHISELEVVASHITLNKVIVSDTHSNILFKDSTVIINNSHIELAQAARLDNTRLDIAGTKLNLFGGINVADESILILSLSWLSNEPKQGAVVLKKNRYSPSDLNKYF